MVKMSTFVIKRQHQQNISRTTKCSSSSDCRGDSSNNKAGRKEATRKRKEEKNLNKRILKSQILYEESQETL